MRTGRDPQRRDTPRAECTAATEASGTRTGVASRALGSGWLLWARAQARQRQRRCHSAAGMRAQGLQPKGPGTGTGLAWVCLWAAALWGRAGALTERARGRRWRAAAPPQATEALAAEVRWPVRARAAVTATPARAQVRWCSEELAVVLWVGARAAVAAARTLPTLNRSSSGSMRQRRERGATTAGHRHTWDRPREATDRAAQALVH